jgi:SseB protein N-terminal domain
MEPTPFSSVIISATLKIKLKTTTNIGKSMPFEPHNDLEKYMVQAQEGKVSLDEFMNTLVESQVFMPVRDELNIGGFQGSTKAVPLSLEDENGTNILVIFTSPDRSKESLNDYPDYKGGLVEIFGKLLQMNGVGYGVTINPSEEVGMDLEPEMVEQLVRLSQASSH